MQNNHNQLYSRGQSSHLKTHETSNQLSTISTSTLGGCHPPRASIPFALIPEVTGTSCDTPNVFQPLFLALTLQCSPMSEGLVIYRVTSWWRRMLARRVGETLRGHPRGKWPCKAPPPYLLFEVVYYEQLSATQQTCSPRIVPFSPGPSASTYDSSNYWVSQFVKIETVKQIWSVSSHLSFTCLKDTPGRTSFPSRCTVLSLPARWLLLARLWLLWNKYIGSQRTDDASSSPSDSVWSYPCPFQLWH